MEATTTDALVWLGVIFCIIQSAIFSGLNHTLLGIGRLRLEMEVAAGYSQVKITSSEVCRTETTQTPPILD